MNYMARRKHTAGLRFFIFKTDNHSQEKYNVENAFVTPIKSEEAALCYQEGSCFPWGFI